MRISDWSSDVCSSDLEHEMAHMTAGGSYASQPSFRFVRGPDGGFYAVSGEVRIDTSPVPGNPEATLRKRSSERRVGQACVSTCRSRWSPLHSQQPQTVIS